jgi:glycosyltransferase involved in cell wall biosynthesis
LNELKASVIVAMFNGEATIEKTLNSLLAQTYNKFEIIVVDDGSTDSSTKIVEKYLKEDRVKYIYKQNGGVAAARNTGIENAGGDIIGFCDQDDLWKPEKLTEQMKVFNDNAHIGVVYSWIEVDREGMLSESHPCFEGDCFKALLMQNFISCCTGMARRDLLLEIGGFDESRELHGVDDRHVWLRLAKITSFAVVKQVLATYVIHGANYSLNEEKMLKADRVCIEKILQEETLSAIEKSWCSEAMFKVYLHYANNFFYINEVRNCALCLLDAWGIKKYRLDLLIASLILSVAPSSFIKGLKRVKQLLKGVSK